MVWGYSVQSVTANHATRVNIWVSFGVNDTWLCHTYNRPFIFCLEAYWQHWYCHYWSVWGAITVLGTVSTAAGMGTMGAGKHKDSTDSGTLSESVLMCIVHFH